MQKGTFTLIHIGSLAKDSTSSYGSYVGLAQARQVAIWFYGSYKSSAGTAAQLDLYPAVAASPGSIDSAVCGSVVLAKAANATKRRTKVFAGSLLHQPLTNLRYLTAKIKHRTGTEHIGTCIAKAIIQYD